MSKAKICCIIGSRSVGKTRILNAISGKYDCIYSKYQDLTLKSDGRPLLFEHPIVGRREQFVESLMSNEFETGVIIPHITELGLFAHRLYSFITAIGQEAEYFLEFNVFIETHDIELIGEILNTDNCGAIQCRHLQGINKVNVLDEQEFRDWDESSLDFR